MLMTPFAVYADGGVCGPNPSRIGGTWAWVWADGRGEAIREESGLVEPCDLGLDTVTNNVTELYAALRLIESLPGGWAGTLHTDSEVTLHRLTHSHSFKGVPDWMRLRVLKAREGRRWTVTLLAGHPTRAELARGYRERNGLPVSRHNVRCDQLCTRTWRECQMRMKGDVA